MLATLLEHGAVSKAALHAALGNPTSTIQNVKVVVSRLRRKSIAIHAIYGDGYRLDEADRDKLRKLLAPSPHQDQDLIQTMNPATP